MARHRGQVTQLIFPLHRFRCSPDRNNRFNEFGDPRRLGYEKDSGTRLAFCQTRSKMIHHSAPVMTDKDPAPLSRELKNLRIRNACENAVSGGSEIDRWFPKAHGFHETVAEVSVGLEADQGCDSLMWALARWSRSQRAGFSSAIGIAFPSNSRSVSSRYLSISAWWSR